MKFYSAIDTQHLPIKALVPESATTAPSSPVDGQLYYNTTSKLLFEYNSTTTTWVAIVQASDSRLTDSRTPTGSAGGDLTGTYPNPTIGANKVLITALDHAIVENGVSSGTAATSAAALRKLGTAADDAMAGNSTLNAIATANAVTADISMNSHKLTSVTDPSSAQDAATKNYVDNLVQGLDAKPSTQRQTQNALGGDPASGTLNSTNLLSLFGSAGVAGYTVGQRLLFKNETTTNEKYNGIYEVLTNNGTLITVGRTADMNTWAEVPGAFVFNESTDTGWVCISDLGGTLGTTAITWAQFSSAGNYIDGAGLTLTGLTFDVNVDSSSIEINSDTLRVKAAGITNAMLAGSIDLTSKVTGSLPIANGGTAGTSATTARTNLAAATRVTSTFSAITGPGIATWNTGLSAIYVYQIYETSSGELVMINSSVSSATISISSDVSVSSGFFTGVAVGIT